MYIREEDSPEVREFKAAAFETILFFPGVDYKLWCQILLKEYTTEVVDALGTEPDEVMESLAEIWEHGQYEDEPTQITKTYAEWAALLKDQRMVDYYYTLVKEANDAKDSAHQ